MCLARPVISKVVGSRPAWKGLGSWACRIGLVNWPKNQSHWIKVVKPIFCMSDRLCAPIDCQGETDCVLLSTLRVRQIVCSYWLPVEIDYALLLTARWDRLCAPIDCQGETDCVLLLTARVRQIVCSYWLPGWDRLCALTDCQESWSENIWLFVIFILNFVIDRNIFISTFRSTRYVEKASSDKILEDKVIEETLLKLFGAFQDRFRPAAPGTEKRLHESNLDIMYEMLGFKIIKIKSEIPDGGSGVGVIQGKIPKGSVAALYPGMAIKHQVLALWTCKAHIGWPVVSKAIWGTCRFLYTQEFDRTLMQ